MNIQRTHEALSGSRTYLSIVAFVLFTISSWWLGNIETQHAAEMLFAAITAAYMRRALPDTSKLNPKEASDAENGDRLPRDTLREI